MFSQSRLRKITIFSATFLYINSNAYVLLGFFYVNFFSKTRNFIIPGCIKRRFSILTIRKNRRGFLLRFEDIIDVFSTHTIGGTLKIQNKHRLCRCVFWQLTVTLVRTLFGPKTFYESVNVFCL